MNTKSINITLGNLNRHLNEGLSFDEAVAKKDIAYSKKEVEKWLTFGIPDNKCAKRLNKTKRLIKINEGEKTQNKKRKTNKRKKTTKNKTQNKKRREKRKILNLKKKSKKENVLILDKPKKTPKKPRKPIKIPEGPIAEYENNEKSFFELINKLSENNTNPKKEYIRNNLETVCQCKQIDQNFRIGSSNLSIRDAFNYI